MAIIQPPRPGTWLRPFPAGGLTPNQIRGVAKSIGRRREVERGAPVRAFQNPTTGGPLRPFGARPDLVTRLAQRIMAERRAKQRGVYG